MTGLIIALVILAALASGKLIDPKSIPTEGITKITLEDTKMAEACGYTIKLIGHTTIGRDGLIAMVSPRMVSSTNPLCRIDDVFNGVLVDANMVGEVMFYGPGAGKLPTASAVVADIIDIIAARDNDIRPIIWEQATKADVADFSEYACRRMFIVNGDIPCNLPNGKTVKNGDLTAYITEADVSEKEATAIAEKLNGILVSTYRIL